VRRVRALYVPGMYRRCGAMRLRAPAIAGFQTETLRAILIVGGPSAAEAVPLHENICAAPVIGCCRATVSSKLEGAKQDGGSMDRYDHT
jgi:hypothetical protein